jgi:uncharacterized protein (TIGR02145 family)/uncharacterized repeat protein (TIGR02543 family)
MRIKKVMLGVAASAVAVAVVSLLAVGITGCGGDSGVTNNSGTNSATYTLTTNVSPTNGGTVSRSPNQTGYASGASVTVTATAASGYTFTGWSGASTSTGASVTITMDGNKALTAIFQPNSVTPPEDDSTYTLTIIVSPANGGTVLRQPERDKYGPGTMVAVAAAAADGYSFAGWTGTLSGAVLTSNDAVIGIPMDGNKTLTANFRQQWGGGPFTDVRNGKIYNTVKIGNQMWMAENLNYDTADGTGSWCYENNPDSCVKYGRLYNWNTAMAGKASSKKNPSGVQGVCPAGWHLPSYDEWDILSMFTGSWEMAGKLKSTSGWYISIMGFFTGEEGNGTDDYGFSALPGGERYAEGNFVVAGSMGGWWMTEEYEDDVRRAEGLYMGAEGMVGGRDILVNAISKGNGLSVRCVGD